MIILILVLMTIFNNRNQVYKIIRLGKGQMWSALMGSIIITIIDCINRAGQMGRTNGSIIIDTRPDKWGQH